MSDYQKELGARLRVARVRRGWSRQGVEIRSGGRWKTGAIGTYERGDRTISPAKLAALAEFYQVPLSELLPPTEGDGLHPDVEALLWRVLDGLDPALVVASMARRGYGNGNGGAS